MATGFFFDSVFPFFLLGVKSNVMIKEDEMDNRQEQTMA